MRASLLLVVVVGLFASSQALDWKELGKNLLDNLVSSVKDKALGECSISILSCWT
jgi:hypothetical protein